MAFPRDNSTGLFVWLVDKPMYSFSLHCLPYKEHVHPALVYVTCVHVYTLCVQCAYRCLCVQIINLVYTSMCQVLYVCPIYV